MQFVGNGLCSCRGFAVPVTGKSVTGVDDRNHCKPTGPDDDAQDILAGFPRPRVAGSARSRGPLLQRRSSKRSPKYSMKHT